MSTTQVRILEICALLLIVFISGFWLARTGRPFRGLPMNLHKFGALVALVLLVMLVVHANRGAHPGESDWIVCGISGVTVLAAIVSGGVVAAQDPVPAAAMATHRIASAVAAILSGAAMWLLWNRA